MGKSPERLLVEAEAELVSGMRRKFESHEDRMNQKTFSLATGLIFLLIAVIHVLRLAFKWEAVLNGWAVPMWVSAVALLIAAYLAFEGLKLSRRS
jgi:hypothetical protein